MGISRWHNENRHKILHIFICSNLGKVNFSIKSPMQGVLHNASFSKITGLCLDATVVGWSQVVDLDELCLWIQVPYLYDGSMTGSCPRNQPTSKDHIKEGLGHLLCYVVKGSWGPRGPRPNGLPSLKIPKHFLITPWKCSLYFRETTTPFILS